MFKTALLALFLAAGTFLGAQKTFPTPDLITLDDQPAALSDYIGQGKPTVIAVWATWCQPCHVELDHMQDMARRWQEELGVHLLAVSVDKRYQMNRIQPLLKRKGWDYDVLVDTNGKLQRQLGFRSIPQMYVLDANGRIVKEYSGYREGRETEVDRVVRQLVAK